MSAAAQEAPIEWRHLRRWFAGFDALQLRPLVTDRDWAMFYTVLEARAAGLELPSLYRHYMEKGVQYAFLNYHNILSTIDRLGAGRWREPVLPRAETESAPPQAKGEERNQQQEAPEGEAEARPKQTEEVTEESVGSSNNVHGRDGASGEVPESTPTTGGNASKGEKVNGQQPPRAPNGGSDKQDRTAQAAPPVDGHCGGGVKRQEAGDDAGETGANPATPDLSDNVQRHAGQEAKGKEYGEAGEICRRTKEPHNEDASSLARGPSPLPKSAGVQEDQALQRDASNAGLGTTPIGAAIAADHRVGWGGNVITPADMAQAMEADLAGSTPAKEVVRALRKLADDLGTLGDATPKWDAKKLVTELVSRRVALSRARREQAEPPVLCILVDASGSCAGVAKPLFAAAIRAARLDERICVIVMSNGEMDHGCYVFGKPLAGLAFTRNRPVDEALLPLIRSGRIGRMVWAGDGDGFQALCALTHASKRPSIWVDSFGARAAPGAYRVPQDQVKEYQARGLHPSAQCWRGVNSPARMAWALKEALK